MLADNNFSYEEQEGKIIITGWRKVSITEITEPKPTKSGDATGFFIRLDVRVGSEIKERNVWLSFDHPNEFVTTKSTNIGAMLRMMFPAITADEDYVGCSFWLLFHTYEDKKTGETKESFFDFKKNVSLDGKESLDGKAITEEKATTKPVAQAKAKANISQAKSSDPDHVPADSGDDDCPF